MNDQPVHRVTESLAEQGIRDLMGLLALPALWAQRDGQTILQIMAEAVERIVPLRFSYAHAVMLPGRPPVTQVRVDGRPIDAAQLAAWNQAAGAWPTSPGMHARVHPSSTPLGAMRVVRINLGYSFLGGSIWFGDADPGFPSIIQLAVLRAAATLAATGLQAAHAKHEREEASRAKDEFLAMLGHELRNPLAPISAAAELLRFGNLDERRIRTTSDVISRQVSHMTNLVNDLLDVSRVTSGLAAIDKEPLDIKKIAADAIEQARPLIEARRHGFTTHMPPDFVEVLGDHKRLVQVVTNLLVNAAKYTPEGGTIELRLEARKSQVVLTVKDNGIGIDPELLPRIFGLFTQAKRSADRSQGGLGLGLALVKSLVGLHGGTVTASSAGMGAGAQLTVTLPRLIKDSNKPVAPATALPAPAPAPKALRIVVVDDNIDAAEMTAMLLEASGHEVHVDHDPHSALERARTHPADVFLLDIGLPRMDGNELARHLRAMPHTHGSIFIALTGYGQDTDRKKSLESGFDHHFVKPVDMTRLSALLTELVRP